VYSEGFKYGYIKTVCFMGKSIGLFSLTANKQIISNQNYFSEENSGEN
jgi:hypothetical protein